MAKSKDAFRTISEVSEWLETPAHVLRFWESRFSQIKPVKRAGGRRYYRPTDMTLLGGIKRLLHDDGITIKGVQKILREKGVKYVSTLSLDLLGGEDKAENKPALQSVATNRLTDTPIEEIISEDQPITEFASDNIVETADSVEPFEVSPKEHPEDVSIFAESNEDTLVSDAVKYDAADDDFSILADGRNETAQTDRMTALYQRLMSLRNRLKMDMVNG